MHIAQVLELVSSIENLASYVKRVFHIISVRLLKYCHQLSVDSVASDHRIHRFSINGKTYSTYCQICDEIIICDVRKKAPR